QRGVDPARLQGTTQNDIIKEYLARGTYIFPPRPSMRLIVDMYDYCLHRIPRWNPSNICSYHLQEAGATPVQELAFALANAEEQPETNACRSLLEGHGVTHSRAARSRALQLPTWTEALSRPRPWDQQWSLRLQQIIAYETDLLEYPDPFDGSPVVAAKVAELKE